VASFDPLIYTFCGSYNIVIVIVAGIYILVRDNKFPSFSLSV